MKLAVILGSTRPERHSGKVADWVVNHAKELADTQVELLDLIDYPLPFFDEAVSPRYNPERKPNEVAKKWLAKMDEVDAFVVVSPEYNHSTSAVLKNAFDYLDWQVDRKPFALVTHGSAGGARAQEHLKGIISEVRGVPIPNQVGLTMRVAEVFDENGTLSEEVAALPYGPQAALDALLTELKWYSDALSTARTKK